MTAGWTYTNAGQPDFNAPDGWEWTCPDNCPTPFRGSSVVGSDSPLWETRVGGVLYSQPCVTASPFCKEISPPSSSFAAGTGVGTGAGAGGAGLCAAVQTHPLMCLSALSARTSNCAYGGGEQCVACPVHARCPGGHRVWPTLGYWTPSERLPLNGLIPTVVQRCNPPIQRCQGLTHGTRVCAQCLQGYR